MGEDNFRSVAIEKKSSLMDQQPSTPRSNGDSSCNGHHSSVSTSSEADSESTTCPGDVPSDGSEQDFQYGPGIVSKLRTKFLSITLKQSRGQKPSMRRSCSLEDILSEQKSSSRSNLFVSQGSATSSAKSCPSDKPWNCLKRAKSMDTLLLSLEEQGVEAQIVQPLKVSDLKDLHMDNGTTIQSREPKVIKRKDGPLSRSVITICDEELPKPDTVKTYKRMFEPAESKKTSLNSNVRRKPPVLRASAKSGSVSNAKSSPQIAGKLNGSLASPTVIKEVVVPKPKISAKELCAKETPVVSVTPTKSAPHFLKKESNSKQMNNNLLPPSENERSKKDTSTPTRKTNFKALNSTVPPLTPVCNGESKPSDISNKTKHRAEVIKTNLRPLKTKPSEVDGSKPKVPDRRGIQNGFTSTIAQVYEETIRSKSPTKIATNSDQKICPEKPVLKAKPTISQEHKNDLQAINRERKSNHNTFKNDVKVPEKSIPKVEDKISQKTSNDQHQEESGKVPPHQQPLHNGTHGETQVVKGPVKPISTVISEEPQLVELKATNSSNVDDIHAKDPKKAPGTVVSTNCVHANNTMVFDFRGKDVVSHLAVVPAPFGCRTANQASKKRPNIEGKESQLNGLTNGCESEEEDVYSTDYSVPPPCGLVFEGENVKIGKGAMLSTRNKDLKIQFDEDVEKNTFIYPSETSMLTSEDSSPTSEHPSLDGTSTGSCASDPAKLANNTATKLRASLIKGSTGSSDMMSYTPSVLRTVDNFQPGLFRGPEKEKSRNASPKHEPGTTEEEEEENRGRDHQDGSEDECGDMLKPADPDLISSWSLSANTSDLLF